MQTTSSRSFSTESAMSRIESSSKAVVIILLHTQTGLTSNS